METREKKKKKSSLAWPDATGICEKRESETDVREPNENWKIENNEGGGGRLPDTGPNDRTVHLLNRAALCRPRRNEKAKRDYPILFHKYLRRVLLCNLKFIPRTQVRQEPTWTLTIRVLFYVKICGVDWCPLLSSVMSGLSGCFHQDQDQAKETKFKTTALHVPSLTCHILLPAFSSTSWQKKAKKHFHTLTNSAE